MNTTIYSRIWSAIYWTIYAVLWLLTRPVFIIGACLIIVRKAIYLAVRS